jgi:hypothetical protein
MRKIPWAAALLSLSCSPAAAEPVYNLNQSQTGFTLPGVSLPQGQDEVRAADGTTCRSSVSGTGAYLDIGVIRGNNSASNDLATYRRVVIPIGRNPKRIDCSKLYQLEVERLQMELKLLKMGLAEGARPAAGATETSWVQEGWSDKGRGR